MGVYVYEYFAYVRHCGCPRVTIEGAGARDRERKRDRKREKKREMDCEGRGKGKHERRKGKGVEKSEEELKLWTEIFAAFRQETVRTYDRCNYVCTYGKKHRTKKALNLYYNIKAKTGGIKIPPSPLGRGLLNACRF